VDPEQHRAATLAAYERLAVVWDEADDNLFNEALERTAVRSLLPETLAGARVLDAGCASGAHAAWLADHGSVVVAIDRSPAMCAQARTRLAGRGSVAVADLGALPFGQQVFDGILCSLALHYVADMAGTLHQFGRLLGPGGWLIVTLDHPFGTVPGDAAADYFAPRLVTDSWEKKGVEVTQAFWRRPLGAVIDDFATAGFSIERIGEPRVDAAAIERFGEEAAQLLGRPTFIAYLARLR
jgi:SAM-dependent methyltransferase